MPDVWSSSTDSKYLSEFHKADLASFLVPDTTVSRRKGPILMSIPLYLIKAEIVGTSLMIREKKVPQPAI